MEFKIKSTRRSFLGATGLIAGVVSLPRRFFSATLGLPAADAASNIYEELGVTTVINGQGTMTTLGGSLIPAEVESAMAAASKYFVRITELQVAAGNRIATMLKLPEGHTALVTSGAAGAITIGTAGVLTGNSEEFIRRLPDLTGMKSEVIIQRRHRYPFDQQIRATGVKLVEVESRDDLRRAVNDKTAMMFFTNYLNGEGHIKVDEFAKLANEFHLPSFNDAAADTPPVSRLWEYNQMGYDMVAFSGGKAIRGPQCAGLLLGRKDLLANALLNTCPHEDTLGRSMKVGKEEIVGMVKALELYVAEDHDALMREWWARLDTVADELKKVPGVSTSVHVPEIANVVPHMEISWDPRRISLTPDQAFDLLRKSKPSIMLGRGEHGLTLASFQLRPAEEKIVAERLVQIFRDHHV
ncbi:MAG TPA: aminotransferase class V-fold PLP-dependent enzyme [Terriglobia bacterium]|nr:aminotransferase class V-fold PLP-dependent enzyme [Terriglobia bacterium]